MQVILDSASIQVISSALMAVPQDNIDSASGGDEIAQLNAIRLDRNWSYQQLAADMGRFGYALPAKTLQSLITNRRPKPYDRTLHQIRQYLDARKAAA